MSWLLLAVIAAGFAFLVYDRRATFMKSPALSEEAHTWLVRGVWVGLTVAALGLTLRGVTELLLHPPAASAQSEPRRAYTTANPATSEWLGLATQDGRYAILLGEGCEQIGPDMNVLASTDMSSPTWTLQGEGSLLVCTVVEWHWMGDTPCFTNADGDCDVANA